MGLRLSILRNQITLRRMVFAAVFLVAVIAFAQLLTLDAALLMAGDIAFYCEIASAVMLIAARGHLRHLVHRTKAMIRCP
jgi:hypothetical protein